MSEPTKLGKATVSPRIIEVGSSPTVKLTYTVGGAGIAPGGGIQIRLPWGCWTPAAMAELLFHRHLEVINSDAALVSRNPAAEIGPRVWRRGVQESWVDISVTGGKLSPGDKIIFTYGVRERPSPPV